MNKQRRKLAEQYIGQLQEIKENIESLKDEEEEAYNNLPDGIQCSERGDEISDMMDHLGDASDSIGDAIDYLNEVL